MQLDIFFELIFSMRFFFLPKEFRMALTMGLQHFIKFEFRPKNYLGSNHYLRHGKGATWNREGVHEKSWYRMGGLEFFVASRSWTFESWLIWQFLKNKIIVFCAAYLLFMIFYIYSKYHSQTNLFIGCQVLIKKY